MESTAFGKDSRYENMAEAQYPGGVVVDPTPITAGQETTVFYDGLLAKSGADQIYLHVGYGPLEQWDRVADLKMSKTGYGWVKTLEAPADKDRINFCFKDSANNWDNNNGLNWTWIIHNGTLV